jgi:LytS/YehU family sensor histidine kinase
MAQENIRQRLKLVYGNRAGFNINATKQNYTVTLEIPVT